MDIWFHLAAETGMGVLLVLAGTAVLRQTPRAPLLSALAIGMLAYSAVNSPGYYAEAGDWAVVAGFGLIVTAAAAAFAPCGAEPTGAPLTGQPGIPPIRTAGDKDTTWSMPRSLQLSSPLRAAMNATPR